MKRLSTILICLGVATLSLQAQVLYEDNFSGGTADLTWTSHWGEESNEIQVDFVTGNPSGDGFVGKLGNDLSGGGVGSIFVDGVTDSDYMVSAEILLVPGQGHYRGLIGRSTGVNGEDPFTFYSFLADLSVDTGMGDERFRLRTHGLSQFPSVIRDWTAAELGDLYPTEEGWSNMALRMEGNQIWCYINDTMLPGCPFTDSNLTSGSFGVYFWSFDDFDDFIFFDDMLVEGTEVSVSEPGLELAFELLPSMPNPFNPSTMTRFRLDHAASIDLAVYNLRGQLVSQLARGDWPAGLHQLSWDGRNSAGGEVASGNYLLRLSSADQQQTQRVLLQR